MNLDTVRRIVRDEIAKRVKGDLTGTVIEIDDESLPVIRLDGEANDVPYDLVDDGLTLTEGDRVLLHRIGGRLLVAHKVTIA